MSTLKIHVGTYKLTEERDVQQLYECAAWEQTITVSPGEYPVYAYLEYDSLRELSVPVRGPIKSACFVARIGNMYGPDHGPETIGQLADGHIDLPTYSDLKSLMESGKLTLDSELVEFRPYTSEEGKEYNFIQAVKGCWQIVCKRKREEVAGKSLGDQAREYMLFLLDSGICHLDGLNTQAQLKAGKLLSGCTTETLLRICKNHFGWSAEQIEEVKGAVCINGGKHIHV